MAEGQLRKEWAHRRARRRSEQAVGCRHGHGGGCEKRLGLRKGPKVCVEVVGQTL